MSKLKVYLSDQLKSKLTRDDILALDPGLFSVEEKKAYIDLLYGNTAEWTWKRDLESVETNRLRWNNLLNEQLASGQPYRVDHQKLLRLAKNYPPRVAGSAVTDFTDWIFRLYVPERDYYSLVRGQRIERDIAIKRIPVPAHSRWKLIYNGMLNNGSSVFSISDLTINGAPIRGKPDLVFREKKTKRILIVEIKVSERELPSNGWPNMRAQLWAYSKIDEWKDAPEVILVGEIWGFRYGLRLRKAIHFRSKDQTFEQENAELFARYSTFCERSTQNV